MSHEKSTFGMENCIWQRNQRPANLPFKKLWKAWWSLEISIKVKQISIMTFYSWPGIQQKYLQHNHNYLKVCRWLTQKRTNLEWIHTFHEERELHLLQNLATNLALLPSHLFAEPLWLVQRYTHCLVGFLLGTNCDLYIWNNAATEQSCHGVPEMTRVVNSRFKLFQARVKAL